MLQYIKNTLQKFAKHPVVIEVNDKDTPTKKKKPGKVGRPAKKKVGRPAKKAAKVKA